MGGCSSQSCSFSSGYVVSWRVNHHSTSPILWLGRCWNTFSKKIETDPWNKPQVPQNTKYEMISFINRYGWGPGVYSRGLLESFPLAKPIVWITFFSVQNCQAGMKGLGCSWKSNLGGSVSAPCIFPLVVERTTNPFETKKYRQIGWIFLK